MFSCLIKVGMYAFQILCLLKLHAISENRQMCASSFKLLSFSALYNNENYQSKEHIQKFIDNRCNMSVILPYR